MQAADKVAAASQPIMHSANTEEDLRIGFEKLLEPLLDLFVGSARFMVLAIQRAKEYGSDDLQNCIDK